MTKKDAKSQQCHTSKKAKPKRSATTAAERSRSRTRQQAKSDDDREFEKATSSKRKKSNLHPSKQRHAEFIALCNRYVPIRNPRVLHRWLSEQRDILRALSPETQEYQLAVICRKASNYATAIRDLNPHYPPLPQIGADAWLYLDALLDWCTTARRGVPSSARTLVTEPVTRQAAEVLELLLALPPHRGMKGPAILDALARLETDSYPDGLYIDRSILTGRIIPSLKPYGVTNKPGVGYYIDRQESTPM